MGVSNQSPGAINSPGEIRRDQLKKGDIDRSRARGHEVNEDFGDHLQKHMLVLALS